MPGRKQKNVKKELEVDEAPVVFRLKVGDETVEQVIPIGDVVSYSDILTSVESSKVSERFNTTVLKKILENTVSDSYSEHTACFWCCSSFEWTATVLPISYDVYKNNYTCEGHFCSPECALAYLYADVSVSDSVRWSRHALLYSLYRELYVNKDLSPAPSRSILRMFGGQLDIQQFREYTSGSNDIVMSELPPIRMLFPTMNVQGPLRDIKRYVSLSTDAVEKASEHLRLKRSKTTNTNIPTLDMCIVKT
jgi:hypothetical protein